MRPDLDTRNELIALFSNAEHQEQAAELHDLLTSFKLYQLPLLNAFKLQPSSEDLVFFLSCFVSLTNRVPAERKQAILIQLINHKEWVPSINFLSQTTLSPAELLSLIDTLLSYPQYIEFSHSRLGLISESSRADFLEKLSDVITTYPTIKGISFLKIVDKGRIISFDFLPNLEFDQNLGEILKRCKRDLSEDQYQKLISLIFTLSQELFDSDSDSDADKSDYFQFFHSDDSTVYECVDLVLEFPYLWQKLTELMLRIYDSKLSISLSPKLAKLLIICLLPSLSEKIEAFQKLQKETIITQDDLMDLILCLNHINEDFCHVPLSLLHLYTNKNLRVALNALNKIDTSSPYYPESLCLELALKTALGEWEPCDDFSIDLVYKKDTLKALKFVLKQQDCLFTEISACERLCLRTAAVRALKSPFRGGLWFWPSKAKAPVEKLTLADTNTTALATPIACKIFG